MTTNKKVEMYFIKVQCDVYAKLGAHFLSKSVDSIMKRNFGDGEHYQILAEKYFSKLQKSVDKLMEMAS